MMKSVSGWLVEHSSHGLWDWVGAIGSTFVGGAAIFGGLVALKSFLASTQASSHAHMHQMFVRYLEARDALSERQARHDIASEDSGNRSSRRARPDFGGVALYYLEEVYAWVQSERRLADQWWMKVLTPKLERERRLDVLASWEATLTTHLITEQDEVLASMRGYTRCYGSEFLTFVAERLNDPELSVRAEQSRVALQNGEDRARGDVEQRQHEQQRVPRLIPS